MPYSIGCVSFCVNNTRFPVHWIVWCIAPGSAQVKILVYRVCSNGLDGVMKFIVSMVCVGDSDVSETN